MTAPLSTCTKKEQSGVVRFLWAKNGSKGYLQRNAAHVGEHCLSRQAVRNWVQKFSEGRTSIEDEHRAGPTATKRNFRRRFPGTCETAGQMFKSVWRLCWKINVVCMSSPFDSFQSRFVTHLLNFPRTEPPFLERD